MFFRSAASLMAASAAPSAPVEFSAPVTLFPDRYARTQSNLHTHFDVAPDGRFLLTDSGMGGASAAPEQIHVVLNWAEEMKRLASPK
ncbi:MAG: hypothetical protein ACT4QD_25165 [Acidobacteriota bacterium]